MGSLYLHVCICITVSMWFLLTHATATEATAHACGLLSSGFAAGRTVDPTFELIARRGL